jgi:hypothetical protein
MGSGREIRLPRRWQVLANLTKHISYFMAIIPIPSLTSTENHLPRLNADIITKY